jgi:putative peptide zinc metalloprotease protein
VRLFGDVAKTLPIESWRVVPGGQKTLPSPALGWRAGGEVPVDVETGEPNKAAEPFFEVIGKVNSAKGVALLDGRSGKIRFELEPEPLLQRWAKRLYQLFQKRYQI